jgi:hypothetical protein
MARSLTGGTHHDRSGQAHARTRSLRCGNRRAAAGRHVRSPTSPTTHAAVAPEKARPRRTTVAATTGIRWTGPLPSKDDPRRAQLPTCGLEARSAGAGATDALDLQRILISGSRAGPAASPRVLQMQKVGGTQLPPAVALLIRGSELDPRWVRNRCPRSTESGTTRARAFKPILEPTGSRAPHMSYSRASEGS